MANAIGLLENWFMHDYDNDTGNVLLVRGVVLIAIQVPSESSEAEPPAVAIHHRPDYVDQFSAPVPSDAREVTVLLRDRSATVREAVLARAGGKCELCDEPGFDTAAGSIYLETHHVVPLAEDGPDHPSNVVAICPKDHRRAHYAADRDDITVQLTAILELKGAKVGVKKLGDK